MMRLFVFFCVLAVAFSQPSPDPSYDHQTATYVGKVAPVTVTETVSVTPFFSPDHSIDTETDLIVSAQTIIRLGIPGFDSWGNCTWASNTSYGCTCSQQRNETFPIFPALLNALNKGVKVQILTNNYSQPYYPNLIDPLAFLQLAGADVRSFTTVTFIHSKYISVDGKKAAVSSVNFSKASFMFNREAGLLIEGSPEIQQFLDGVFDSDFAIASPWNTIQYSASDMAIIQDKTALPVIIPPANKLNNSYITPATTVTANMQIQAIASPDLSYDTITAAMENASSVKLFIYQITDDMCDYISNNSKIFKTIFVSNEIYDKTDYYSAKACYTRLYNQGLSIRKTEEHVFKYSHQKFWIIDDTTVFLSTGNWGTTDYPNGSMDYPPFTSSSWRKINRDFTIQITNPEIVSIFSKVLEEDYERGWDWWPYNPSEEEKEKENQF